MSPKEIEQLQIKRNGYVRRVAIHGVALLFCLGLTFAHPLIGLALLFLNMAAIGYFNKKRKALEEKLSEVFAKEIVDMINKVARGTNEEKDEFIKDIDDVLVKLNDMLDKHREKE